VIKAYPHIYLSQSNAVYTQAHAYRIVTCW